MMMVRVVVEVLDARNGVELSIYEIHKEPRDEGFDHRRIIGRLDSRVRFDLRQDGATGSMMTVRVEVEVSPS